MTTSTAIIQDKAKVVNVASVSHHSPFRYPGGKTWFVPHMRSWIGSLHRKPGVLLEPFAGGAIVGLTIAAENLARHVIIAELDDSVASVWQCIFSEDCDWLIERIMSYEISRENVLKTLAEEPAGRKELAFHTILRNRVQRGGILAAGATLVKNGENGRGVASRWYPQTLAKRIRHLRDLSHRITFEHCDALTLIRRHLRRTTTAYFVDPPYTAGGKSAGSRLYTHSHIDHEALFALLSKANGPVLMTYDDAPEVRGLAQRFGFQVEEVPMKNTHHAVMHELVISNMGTCVSQMSARRLATKLTSRLAAAQRDKRPPPALFK